MKKNSRILYVGNNLVKKTKYSTSITILSELLKLENYQVTVVSEKENKILRLLDMIKSTYSVKNKVDFILIDTFSTINFYYAFLISQFSRILNIKYIPILRGGNLPSRLKSSNFLSKLIFKYSYVNIAPSNYLKEEFRKYNFDTEYIPNTILLNDYKLKKRLTIRPKLLWVRSFKELYNPTLAIEVLKLLKVKYPKATLCMIGPFYDDSYEKAKSLVKQYQLEKSIEFTGVLSKKNWHKKSENFDIFINTTNFDNTPITVMEAMALGLPIVSTNVGGMPYLIDNNVDGLLVDKNNVNQMTNAIISLIEENNQDLILNARKKVENFDWEVVKEKWNSILN